MISPFFFHFQLLLILPLPHPWLSLRCSSDLTSPQDQASHSPRWVNIYTLKVSWDCHLPLVKQTDDAEGKWSPEYPPPPALSCFDLAGTERAKVAEQLLEQESAVWQGKCLSHLKALVL